MHFFLELDDRLGFRQTFREGPFLALKLLLARTRLRLGLGAAPLRRQASPAMRRLLLGQFARCDEYKPSRRSIAPRDPDFVQRSASRRIEALYFAVNRRRVARDATSGSGALPREGRPPLRSGCPSRGISAVCCCLSVI